MVLKGYILSLLYGMLCLLVAFIAYKLGVNKKYTRKIVHILIGFEWLILYYYMGATVHFVAVCIIFTILVGVSHYFKSLPMITSDSENSAGTIYYCVSMTVMSVSSLFVPDAVISFGVAVFCTSMGDGFAGVIGQSIKRANPTVYLNKTLFGALANFAFSFITAALFVYIFELSGGLGYIFTIAFVSMAAELISKNGLDNITIPLSVFLVSMMLLNHPIIYNYIIPIIATPLILAILISKGRLTSGGVLCALFLDILVSLAFGNFGFLMILIFLLGGSLMDILKRSCKRGLFIESSAKSRTYCQFFANSAISMLCALFYLIFPDKIFFLAFCVTVIEAFADTAASAFGVLSKNTYDIFRFKRCQKGLSGGVSLIGTSSALAAVVLLSIFSAILNPISIYEVILISITAFFGVIIDTAIGSLLQIKYKCVKCGSITERKACCDSKCEKYSGISFIGNAAVNLISSIATVLIFFLLYIVVF